MGYRTRYRLTVEPESMDAEVRDLLTRLAHGSTHLSSPFMEDNQQPWDGCKWYKNKEDIAIAARLFPSVSITVHCVGEDDEGWIVTG